MKKLLLPIFFVFSSVLFGQTDYLVQNPFVNLIKTTDYGVMHEYIQINNLSGQEFDMRWICEIPNKSGCPAGWDIILNDPDTTTDPLNHNDSSDFVLQTDDYYNKLIIGVTHNGVLGSCNINFRIFPLQDPSNVTLAGFNVGVTQGTGVGVNELTITSKDNIVYPNPSAGLFYINKEVISGSVFNLLGEKVIEVNSNKIDLSNYENGVYIANLQNRKGENIQVKLIKN